MQKLLLQKLQNLLLYKSSLGEIHTKYCDLKHHIKYSFKESRLKNDRLHLQYYLTKQYHIIEKGLSLPEPRLGFGQPKILNIIKYTTRYESLYGSDDLTKNIRKTISEYLQFNQENSFQLNDDLSVSIEKFLSETDLSGYGGVKSINNSMSSPLNGEEFYQFAKSRVSVRDFSNEDVSSSTIYSAIDAAKTAPSVCNRQGWKVHLYTDKARINDILSYQNGNTGFTDSINKLLIVTADSKAFTSFESNQVFTDGGLFSMNLLLALHAASLGACPLNTCLPYFKEKKVKEVSSIPDNERLIMMIAVGSLKENYKVACSARHSTDDILTVHSN